MKLFLTALLVLAIRLTDTRPFVLGKKPECHECVDVELELVLDEDPSDTGYSLICGDHDVVWDVAPHTFLVRDGYAHETVYDHACIDPQACCVFTVHDSAEFPHGLTSPFDDEPGRFEVKYW